MFLVQNQNPAVGLLPHPKITKLPRIWRKGHSSLHPGFSCPDCHSTIRNFERSRNHHLRTCFHLSWCSSFQAPPNSRRLWNLVKVWKQKQRQVLGSCDEWWVSTFSRNIPSCLKVDEIFQGYQTFNRCIETNPYTWGSWEIKKCQKPLLGSQIQGIAVLNTGLLTTMVP